MTHMPHGPVVCTWDQQFSLRSCGSPGIQHAIPEEIKKKYQYSRAGRGRWLKKRKPQPALSLMVMWNVMSLVNKMDKLAMLTRREKVFFRAMLYVSLSHGCTATFRTLLWTWLASSRKSGQKPQPELEEKGKRSHFFRWTSAGVAELTSRCGRRSGVNTLPYWWLVFGHIIYPESSP